MSKALAAQAQRAGLQVLVRRGHGRLDALGQRWPRLYGAMAWLGWIALGGLLGVAAWGHERAPTPALLLPLLLYTAPRRRDAFALGFGYYAALLRFIPSVAGEWFAGSELDSGLAPGAWWLLASAASAGLWALFWTRSSNPWVVAAAALAGFVALMAPPLGGFITGHPIIGWAALAPVGSGWVALLFGVVANVALCAWDRARGGQQGAGGGEAAARHFVREDALWGLVLIALLWAAGVALFKPVPAVAGDVVAVATSLGEPPRTDEQVMQRIEYTGRVVRALAKLDGGAPRLSVFPESMLGPYDTTFAHALRSEVEQPARQSGQTVILGAELHAPGGARRNVAIVMRPQGQPQTLPMRQPVPLTLWRPWDAANHSPIQWRQEALVQVSPEIAARVMICYELMLPMLHLWDTAAAPHNVVVGLANHWADQDGLTMAIQEAHAQPMAAVFGKFLVIAANAPKHVQDRQSKLQQASAP